MSFYYFTIIKMAHNLIAILSSLPIEDSSRARMLVQSFGGLYQHNKGVSDLLSIHDFIVEHGEGDLTTNPELLYLWRDAIKHDRIDVIKYLYGQIDRLEFLEDFYNDIGVELLLYAIKKGREDILQYLVSKNLHDLYFEEDQNGLVIDSYPVDIEMLKTDNRPQPTKKGDNLSRELSEALDDIVQSQDNPLDTVDIEVYLTPQGQWMAKLETQHGVKEVNLSFTDLHYLYNIIDMVIFQLENDLVS